MLRRKRLLRGRGVPGSDFRLAVRLGLCQRQPGHPDRGRQSLLVPGGAYRIEMHSGGGRCRSALQRSVPHEQAAPRSRVCAVPGPGAVVGGLPILRRPRPDAPRHRVHADDSGLHQGRGDPDDGPDDALWDAHPQPAGGRRADTGGDVPHPGHLDVSAQASSRRGPDRCAARLGRGDPARTS